MPFICVKNFWLFDIVRFLSHFSEMLCFLRKLFPTFATFFMISGFHDFCWFWGTKLGLRKEYKKLHRVLSLMNQAALARQNDPSKDYLCRWIQNNVEEYTGPCNLERSNNYTFFKKILHKFSVFGTQSRRCILGKNFLQQEYEALLTKFSLKFKT